MSGDGRNGRIVRMAMFLCKVDGVTQRVRLCSECHNVLRELIADGYKMAANRIACDCCTRLLLGKPEAAEMAGEVQS